MFYLAKSLTNKLYLKRKLYRLKIEEGKDLVKHLNIFKKILNQLKKVNMKKIRRCFLYLSLTPMSTLWR